MHLDDYFKFILLYVKDYIEFLILVYKENGTKLTCSYYTRRTEKNIYKVIGSFCLFVLDIGQ